MNIFIKSFISTILSCTAKTLVLLAFTGIFNATCQANTPAPIRYLLSFDDGPSGRLHHNPTEKILDVLAQNSVQPGIKAIFFTQTRAINGGGTEIGQKLMHREWEEGHLLGFHTATPDHTNHRSLSKEELQQSLADGIADLTKVTGSAPKLMRPPFWSYDENTFAVYQQNDMQVLMTDLSANDGKIWGVNFSLTKHSNMYRQLAELHDQWRTGKLPIVDGYVPIVVTFHDLNTYTASHMEEYLQILLKVAAELTITTATVPFYDHKEDLERAALARTLRDPFHKAKLPGLWDWWWRK